MFLLTPWSALIAAAVALPLLLLLYLLKLRRQPMRIASTLLWRKAVQDLQVNSPFQRLRWSVLLLIQLLILMAILSALAQPMLEGEASTASRIIVLIDRSASMGAMDAGSENAHRSRLEDAKARAIDMANGLGRRDQSAEMMVIAFASTAEVVSGYQGDPGLLREAIASIVQTDEEANLEAALELAGAFGVSGEERQNETGRPEVVLISDGTVRAPEAAGGFSLRAGRFRFVRVGPVESVEGVMRGRGENIGIVSFSARRDFADPATVQVFGRLVNSATSEKEVVATLFVNDRSAATRRVPLPAATDAGAGEASVTMSVMVAEGAVLRLQQGYRDALGADDAAWLVLPPPASPRVAVVRPDDSEVDPFLEEVLGALQPAVLDRLTMDGLAGLDAARLDAGEIYDLIVFDRVSAQRLPGVATISMGALPAGVTAREATRAGGRRIVSWSRRHPLMRTMALDQIVFSGFGAIELPSGATVLASGPDGPVMIEMTARGARHVVVGFALRQSNWATDLSIALFMQNARDYLTLSASGDAGLAIQAGAMQSVRPAAGARALEIRGPLSTTVQVGAGRSGDVVTLPALSRAGLYEVNGAAPPWDRLAVNVMSDVESDARPRVSVRVNAEGSEAGGGGAVYGRALWPVLAALALVLVVVEWCVYLAATRR